MRNIFVFIWRNHFVFLFLILQGFSVYLLIQNNNYHRSGFINSANIMSGNFLNLYSNITEYFSAFVPMYAHVDYDLTTTDILV